MQSLARLQRVASTHCSLHRTVPVRAALLGRCSASNGRQAFHTGLFPTAPKGRAFFSSPTLAQGSLTLSRRSSVVAAAMAPGIDAPAGADVAVLGGGCFWCLEACYQQLKGVSKVESGYAGGHVDNPTYEQVCGKKTGHAEVVAITYDPAVVSFKELLEIFFTIHDPTTPNRQGNDAGPQYRSIILYTSDDQKAEAEEVMAEVSKDKWYSDPLVTELVPLERYWPGEGYHQNYYNDNPNQGYCKVVVGPKVAKFRSKFFQKLAK